MALLLQNTPVISNEVRNLLLLAATTKADFSPDKAGFEMTGAGGVRGKGSAVRVGIQIGSRPSPGKGEAVRVEIRIGSPPSPGKGERKDRLRQT
jgi:hypothetical protein